MGKRSDNPVIVGDGEGTNYVINSLRPTILKYGESLGLSLDESQVNALIDKLYPVGDRFKSDNSAAERSAKLDSIAPFILPMISQLKLNPKTGNGQIEQAGNAIKTVLGRDATPEESEYFAKELAQGKTAYELQQELMSLPEYQKTLAAKDRETLGAELLTQQQLAFQKATPTIISQFMKAGRIGSSGLDAALANAQKELEQQRQGYLGQVGYQDRSSIRGNAYNNYNNATNQFKDIFGTVGQTSTNYNLLGGAIKRMNEQSDYARQQNDYMNYLNMQNKSNEKAAQYQMYGQIGAAGLGALAGRA
jgi:hypothetical protein